MYDTIITWVAITKMLIT